MAIQKEIIETELRTTTTQSQASLAKLEGATGSLIDKNKELRLAMSKLEADGKKNGDQWKNLSTLYKENGNAITQNKGKMELLRREIGITGLSASQLGKRANELKRELNNMTKSADPARWNKLNNELKQVHGQMDRVKAGSNNIKSSFMAIKALLPAMGFAAVGAAVIKFGKNILNATDALQDKFQVAVEVSKSVTDTFFKTLGDGRGFKAFVQGLLDAAAAGKKYAEDMDIVEDRTRALGLMESEFRKVRIEQLRILRSELSTRDQQIAAGTKIIEEEDKIRKIREDIAVQAKNAKLESFAHLGITEDIVLQNLKNYEVNRNIIKDADQYNVALKERAAFEKMGSTGADISISQKYADVLKTIANTDEDTVEFAQLRLKYTDLNKEQLDELMKLYVEINEVQASAMENNLKVSTRVEKLIVDETQAKEKAADKEIKADDKVAENAIKKRQDAYNVMAKLLDEQYAGRATVNEKEIEDIQRKHEAIIESAMNADEDLDKIKQLEAQRDKEVNDKIIEQNKEKDQKILDTAFELQEKKFQLLQEYEQFTSEELEQMELDRLTELYTEEEQKHQEFLDLKAAIEDKYREQREEKDEEDRKKRLDNIKEGLAGVEAITQVSLNAINSMRNTDLDELEAQKQKELNLAGDNADKKEAIEEEYAEKAKAIKKKYADIEFILTVANITATTAQAAISAYESMVGIPFVGPVLAVIAAAATVAYGGIQIANANKQRNIVKQLATGKYPVTGADDGHTYNADYYGPVSSTRIFRQPTLISEQGPEMVVSAPHLNNVMSNNPALFDAFMNYNVRQRAEGKYNETMAPASQSAQQGQTQQTLILSPGMVDALNKLNSILEAGIISHVALSEIKAAEETMDNVEKYAGKNPIIGWAPFPLPQPVYKFEKK